MFEKLSNIFQVPELRRRILFTLGLFVVYRLGEHLPTPGVDAAALQAYMNRQAGSLFGRVKTESLDLNAGHLGPRVAVRRRSSGG